MKKILIILLACIFFTACNKVEESVSPGETSAGTIAEITTVSPSVDEDEPFPEAVNLNEPGNTHGNIRNSGVAAIQGDWIYYTNFYDNVYLYKIRTD
jgi:hypothetical protein